MRTEQVKMDNKLPKKRYDKCNKIAILIAIALVLCACGGYVGVKFINHEKNQNAKILQLQADASLLKGEINRITNPSSIEYSDRAFNYLAIGNSITKHGLSEYWWNEIGMAATTEDKDYVHLLKGKLEASKGEVCMYAYNFSTWELQAADRAETYTLIDGYLSDKLNLVTIQLSENASDLSTFERDSEDLIRYIHKKAPNAQIILIDDFWSDGVKSSSKIEAAKNTGCDFVSLADIRGKSEFQCGIGTEVYDPEGKAHVVEHDGVAGHPGDKGMAYIAGAVFDVIK